MTDPRPTSARMILLTLRMSSSSSAHGPAGRFASCVLDLLGQEDPRTPAGQEPVI